MVNFAVELSIFGGPMDLLLYLVRREELEVTDVSLAKVTSQYLDFLEVLQEIDIDAVADFLEPIGLLIEMKARDVLPSSELSKRVSQAINRIPTLS
jgi:segregation and condensation protein A